jgi:plasmid stabilization system protein ParE
VKPLRLQPDAETHLRDAYEWYEAQRSGLGIEFNDEVQRFLNRVRNLPESCPVHRAPIRRGTTRRFPYLIFYVNEPDAVVVIAILHTSRDPLNWP